MGVGSAKWWSRVAAGAVDDGACLDFLRLKPWELSLAHWLT
jgi:hypothetical protein